MSIATSRPIVGAVVAGALVLTAILSTDAGAAPSPDGEVLVVTANLREAFEDGGDLRNQKDMDVFVRRVLDQAPHAPDAFVLQEVNGKSAAYVAKALTRKSDSRYVVAVDPGPKPTRVEPGRSIHTETAILLNATTMEKASPGGYLSTSYDRSAARPGRPIQVKRNAQVLAREKSSGTKVALASVHFAPVSEMASKSVSNNHRGRWAKQIAGALAKRYPSATIKSIGGDFNAGRCYTGKFKSCNEAAYWRVLVRKKGYTDSIYKFRLPSGVDYVFAKSKVLSAGLDLDYDSDRAERGEMPYYSDHMFRWAVLAPR